MSEELFWGRPVSVWLAEHRQMENALASRLDPDGERVEIGDDWIDLLPIPCDDGSTEVHVLGSSDPDLTEWDVYRLWFGHHEMEAQMQAATMTTQEKTDPFSEIWASIECLRQEVAALKRAGKPNRPTISSPYLTAEEAAAYLGITMDSLYGLVDRRILIPLRGPRRRYRFTKEMLDEYLRREQP